MRMINDMIYVINELKIYLDILTDIFYNLLLINKIRKLLIVVFNAYIVFLVPETSLSICI